MNSRTIVSALIILSLSANGLAFAQRDSSFQTNAQQYHPGSETRKLKRPHYQNPPHKQARHPRHPNYQGRAYNMGQREGRGIGPNYQFHKGDRLPLEYRHHNYVINDWRSHNLSAPPRGYHWVQIGGDYVLVAIATGIILTMILSN